MRRFTLMGASKTERLAYRQAFIPKGAVLVPGPDGGVVYTYDHERDGRSVPYALAFIGTAGKPGWHHSFKTTDARAAYIAGFHRSLTLSADARATRNAAKAGWINPLTAGAILYTSWGYDQTNVEFYVVTRVSGRRTWVRQIAAEYEATGHMSGWTWPTRPISCIGEETCHTARQCGDSAAIKINGSVTAYVETTPDRKHSTSSYA